MTINDEDLILRAQQSSLILQFISQFDSQDIDGDLVDLRFELDGIETGTDVSITEQCNIASQIITELLTLRKIK